MCKAPTQLVLINSRNRVSGTISSGTFPITVCQSSIGKIRLENFVILNAFLAVTAANNTFTLTESLGPSAVITISPGTYDTTEFATEVAAQIAAAVGLANTYTVSVSPTTLALTITASGGALDPFSLSWGLAGAVMGYGSNPAPTVDALTQTSPFAVQLGNLNKLLIRLETNNGGQMLWATSNSVANFVVDIDVNFGSYFSYTPSVETQNVALYPQPIVPRQVRIELIDAETGALVDTRGSEYQIELAMWSPCACE